MSARRRRGELDDIRRNAAGEYVYTGELYVYRGQRPRIRTLAELWCLAGGAALTALAAGLLPAPGMTGCWYVPVPYVLGLVSLAAALWALGRLSFGGDPIRAYIAENAGKSLPRRLLAAVALLTLALLGEGFYLLRHGAADALGYLVLTGGSLLVAVCALLRQRRMKWEKQ